MITFSRSSVGQARLLQKAEKRFIYAKEILILTSRVSLKNVSFYFDGVPFEHKMKEMRTYGCRA